MNNADNTAAISVTVIAGPRDSRCKWWCRVIRAGVPLPLPSAVSGAGDLPGSYLRQGDDVELEPGDVLVRGEEVNHRKQRGWTYDAKFYNENGKAGRADAPGTADLKALLKRAAACGVITRERAKELLGGSGDVAGLVRWLHVRRSHGTMGALVAACDAAEAAR